MSIFDSSRHDNITLAREKRRVKYATLPKFCWTLWYFLKALINAAKDTVGKFTIFKIAKKNKFSSSKFTPVVPRYSWYFMLTSEK